MAILDSIDKYKASELLTGVRGTEWISLDLKLWMKGEVSMRGEFW